MPEMNALVPSMGSMTQVKRASGPLVPVLLAENAVVGATLVDQRADRGLGLAVSRRNRRVARDVLLVLDRKRLPEIAQDDRARRIGESMRQGQMRRAKPLSPPRPFPLSFRMRT